MSIVYNEGDYCEGIRYSSQIDFICDASVEYGKPILMEVQTVDDYYQCHFVFEWRSRLACPICNSEQVDKVKGQCQENQLREVSTKPIDPNVCQIFPKLSTKATNEFIKSTGYSPLVY